MPDPDRDKSVEVWLRQTPVPGARADGCLDAETLAAWSEGLLDGPQRATAEAHASSCARCQAMLAVMVRTTPVAAASTGSPIRKWLMMLGPPMAAAAAVALWFAVGQGQRTPVVDTLSKLAKSEAEPEPARVLAPGSPASASSAPQEADRQRPNASSDSEVQRRERAAPMELADARKAREARPEGFAAPTSAAPVPAIVAPVNEKKDLAAAKRVDSVIGSERLGATAPATVASAATPPPPPPAPSRPAAESVQAAAGNRPAPAGAPVAAPAQQVNQAQNQAQNQAMNQAQNQAPNQNQAQTQNQSPPLQRQQALEERVIVADKPIARTADDSAAASRAAGRGGVAGGFTETGTRSFRAKVGDFELAVAASAIRWRVAEGRTVQHSPDAGATWSNHYTAASGVFLTAGAAPSSTVCWLVGRAGAIVVTTDGASWARVTFPEAADLTSVVAPDARTATVTTVDGRRFATADGGRTWTRQ